MNWRAVAGGMSASITHEVNQPLTAILSNAEAALDLLRGKNLDLEKVREIVADIIDEDTRASEVVSRIRNLLGKGETPVGNNRLESAGEFHVTSHCTARLSGASAASKLLWLRPCHRFPAIPSSCSRCSSICSSTRWMRSPASLHPSGRSTSPREPTGRGPRSKLSTLGMGLRQEISGGSSNPSSAGRKTALVSGFRSARRSSRRMAAS